MRGSTGLATVCAALLLVSGGEIVTHGPLTRIDTRIADHYTYSPHLASLQLARWLAGVGQPWIACVVVGGLGLLITLFSQRVGPVLAASVALGITGVGTAVLKALFPHPSIYFHLPGSFPSGHTAVAVASSGLVLRLLLPAMPYRETVALTAAAGWGALMAWSRLVLDAHWLSDVLAGWAMGMIALVVAIRLVHVTVSPSAIATGLLKRAGSWRDIRRSKQIVPDDR